MLATLSFISCVLFCSVESSAPAPPTFKGEQTNTSATVDASAVRLFCRVTGSTKTKYWWTRNDVPIRKSRKYRIKRFRYLRIRNVEKSDEGEYVCWAKNEAGEIQRTITFIVEDLEVINSITERKPYFTEPGKMRKNYLLIPAGHKLRIVCSASGVPAPTVTWYKDGKQLKYMPDDLTLLTITSFVVTFNSLRLKDTGKYMCNVSNSFGSINMTYDVEVKEIMISKPVLQSIGYITAYEGDNVTITCKALSDALPHFQWVIRNPKNNNSIEILKPGLSQEGDGCDCNGRRCHCLNLRLVDVTQEDERDYYCIVGNNLGYGKQKIQLKVLPKSITPKDSTPRLGQHGKGAPWFVKPMLPKKFSIAWPASNDIKLRCPADGEPPLKYQWLKDGKVLKYRRLDRRFNSTRSYLRIKTAVPSDNGLYKCIVSNRLGNISHDFDFTVIEKPQIRPVLSIHFPVNKTARVGDNVTFQCIELFSPMLTDCRWLHWKKLPPHYPELRFESAPSANSSYYTMIQPQQYDAFAVDKKARKYGHRVRLNNVTKEDGGMYTCLISNLDGKGWRSSFLKVIDSGKKKAPKEFIMEKPVILPAIKDITAYEGDNVTITCKAVSDHLPHIKWIAVNPNNSIEILKPGLSQFVEQYVCDRNNPRWHCANLRLVNVTQEDERDYYCMVVDSRGYDKQKFQLKVLPKSITPKDVGVGKPEFVPSPMWRNWVKLSV